MSLSLDPFFSSFLSVSSIASAQLDESVLTRLDSYLLAIDGACVSDGHHDMRTRQAFSYIRRLEMDQDGNGSRTGQQ